nr:hypothetical protein [Tanacetum cinerariifolium]
GDTAKDSDKSADKGSDSTDETTNVLGTLGAANILASGGLRLTFTTASIVVSPAVVTASGSFPTALARDLEANFAQEDQIIKEQTERDYEIAMIHAKRELKMMIAELDRSNKMVAKYLSGYEKAEARLSHDEKVELIDEHLMYQRHLAQIKKYQAQQNKPATNTKRRNFYMLILRSNAGWKAKDFKGMTFEQIEEKFIPLDKESFKKLKTTEASGTNPTQEQQSKQPKELSGEELKKMMELVLVEELYIKALQKFDREELDKLWILVKETCSKTKVSDEKEKGLWVELKRIYEPDSRDPLWALQRYMHDPLIPTVSVNVLTADIYTAKKVYHY